MRRFDKVRKEALWNVTGPKSCEVDFMLMGRLCAMLCTAPQRVRKGNAFIVCKAIKTIVLPSSTL